MMIRFRLLLILVFAGILAGPLVAQEDQIYQRVSPSLVRLENPETTGSGILLNEDGYILTNAHVVLSPLSFRVHIDSKEGEGKEKTKKKKKTFTYRNVEKVGIHPEYNLALIRINPKEHPIKIKPVSLSETPADTGRTVYIVGKSEKKQKNMKNKKNEEGGDQEQNEDKSQEEKKKTESENEQKEKKGNHNDVYALESHGGLIQIGGNPYYQFKIQTVPRDTGKPLCEANGQVVGLMTYRVGGPEGYGTAIPLHEISTDAFVPFHQRRAEPEKVQQIREKASQYAVKATEIREKKERETKVSRKYRRTARFLYRLALVYRPNDPESYKQIGMHYRNAQKYELAIAYLIRAIEIDPWGTEKGEAYRELSRTLADADQKRASVDVLKEGVRKFPEKGGKMWEDLSLYYSENGQHFEAAYNAKVGVEVGDVRTRKLNRIFRTSRKKLRGYDKKKLPKQVEEIPKKLENMKRHAKEAKKEGTKFMTSRFRHFYEDYMAAERIKRLSKTGLTKEDNSDDQKAGKPENGSASESTNEVEDGIGRKIKSKMGLAKTYYQSGMKKKAIKMLNDLISRYPDHKQTGDVRKLKEKWSTTEDQSEEE